VKKLQQVSQCFNLPIKSDNNINTNYFKGMLNNLGNKKHNTVEYSKKNSFGRLYAKGYAIQHCPKNVRNYICGEYYYDVDFVSCHPYILRKLMNDANFNNTFLDNYCNDREGVMKKLNFKDKIEIFNIIYNKKLPTKYKGGLVELFHNKLYKWFELCVYNKNKQFYNKYKKNSPDNFMGSILSLYIQDKENELLMCLVDYFKSKNINVDILMYDGCMIRKNYDINQDVLDDCSKYILEHTGFDMKLSFKSTDTIWVPQTLSGFDSDSGEEEDEKDETPETYNLDTVRSLYLKTMVFINPEKNIYAKDKKGFDNWMNYMNKFLCVFNNPHIYGIRFNINDLFMKRSSQKIKERTGRCITPWTKSPVCLFSAWNEEQSKNTYYLQDFIVNKDDPNYSNDNIYNLYRRPEYIITEHEVVYEKCSKFFSYLEEVICNNDKEVYKFLIKWIAKIINYGKTSISIILLGSKGIGKSTLYSVLEMLIGKDYCTTTCDIERIIGRFNSRSQNILLTCIEEVENDQGSRHAFNSKMKSLITETKKTYESKGVDDFDGRDNNNYMFCTNGINPVGLTSDNRRYASLEVNPKYKKNGEYFVNVLNNVRDNVEILRGYFVDIGYEPFLERLKPTTKSEMNLIDLNTTPVDRFINECMDEVFTGKFIVEGFEHDVNIDNGKLSIKELYTLYKLYHRDIGENSKIIPLKYFKASLERNGYNVKRMTYFGRELVCVSCE